MIVLHLPGSHANFVGTIKDFYHSDFSRLWCFSRPFPKAQIILQYVHIYWFLWCMMHILFLTDMDNFWPFSKDASSALPWPQVFVLKPLEERYSVVDMFAGKAAITRAFRAKHLHAATLDLVIDPRDELWLNMCIIVWCHVPCQPLSIWSCSWGINYAKDILTSEGFVRHLWACLNMSPGALCCMGVVCSTWSICNRNLVPQNFDWSIHVMYLTYTY